MSDPEPAATPAIDTVVIGASAGGLRPLRAIVAGLPDDFPATVLVVLHVAATGTSVLPQILGRATRLEVVPAEDGVALTPGRVIVARPDRHLVIAHGVVHLSRGPRENGHRPAIDPLMRAVARARGPRAAGVILSGTRDDGTQGLAELKRCGGVAIVQDPEEAEYAGMPANALAGTPVDAVLPSAAIAAALVDLASGGRRGKNSRKADAFFLVGGKETLGITCPDCGGVLTETDEAGVVHFRCHVGHAFSPRSLLALHAEGVERAMWTAARSLEDRAMLLRRLADRARGAGNRSTTDQFEANAGRADDEARAIRAAIEALDDGFTADAPETSTVPDGEEIME
ncbi:MAG TPA: chemotaxis protein CheB [Baekduia sp.]|nr:chemotaxis protein CheB [Baekduia sp.]